MVSAWGGGEEGGYGFVDCFAGVFCGDVFGYWGGFGGLGAAHGGTMMMIDDDDGWRSLGVGWMGS